MSAVFDRMLAPFGAHATAALVAVSLLTGIAGILLFKLASNPDAIRRVRARVVAHILEMRIYQDDLVLILRALGATLATQLRYLRIVAWPVLVIAVLVAIVYPQLEARFGRAPLAPSDAALVTVTMRPGIDVMGQGPRLIAGPGASIDAARVRVPARREVSWRVRAERQGSPALTLRAGGADYRFALAAAPGTGLIGDRRTRAPLDGLLHPGLPALPPALPVEAIAVDYPPARRGVPWLLVFAAGMLVGALIPMRLFRIPV